jgi:hypothetical protein
MVETASHRNKGAGARSLYRRVHLWWRRRAAGLVSSQIHGSGEGGFLGRSRSLCGGWALPRCSNPSVAAATVIQWC